MRNGRRASDDPVTRDAIVQQAIAHEGLRQNARRARVPALNDHPMRLRMQQGVLATELEQHARGAGQTRPAPVFVEHAARAEQAQPERLANRARQNQRGHALVGFGFALDPADVAGADFSAGRA